MPSAFPVTVLAAGPMGTRLLRNKFSRVQNALLRGLIEPDGFGAGGLGDAAAVVHGLTGFGVGLPTGRFGLPTSCGVVGFVVGVLGVGLTLGGVVAVDGVLGGVHPYGLPARPSFRFRALST